MKNWRHDLAYPQKLAGVDEAGRGPGAGPVVAAAVIAPADIEIHPWAAAVNDSKKLTESAREELFGEITRHCICAVAEASVAEIDSLNILQASLLAMRRAVESLAEPPVCALIDGNKAPPLTMAAHTIIKGDQLSWSIAAASILAKVTRDRLMVKLAAQYPAYGFEIHKGYLTPKHLAALQAHGPCPAHRQSFAPVRNLMKKAA
ncbi:MAG: ribonuclease HII [Dongiaceae bacterium]